jgi:hypothetical protein
VIGPAARSGQGHAGPVHATGNRRVEPHIGHHGHLGGQDRAEQQRASRDGPWPEPGCHPGEQEHTQHGRQHTARDQRHTEELSHVGPWVVRIGTDDVQPHGSWPVVLTIVFGFVVETVTDLSRSANEPPTTSPVAASSRMPDTTPPDLRFPGGRDDRTGSPRPASGADRDVPD